MLLTIVPRSLLVRSSKANFQKLVAIGATRNFSSPTLDQGTTTSHDGQADATKKGGVGFGMTLEPSNNVIDKESRKLAMVCGWMGAKPRQLKVYKDFYSNRGYDVLSFAVGPEHVLRPQKAIDMMEAVLEETVRPSNGLRAPDTVVTHCFSVGGYLMGQLLRVLNDPSRLEDKELYHQLHRAQIYDSPPDMGAIPRGMGAALEMGPVVAKSVEHMINLYLWSVKDTAGVHHRASSEHFHDNHLPAPSLWMYSHKDVVASPHDIQVVMEKWRAKGRAVEEVVWDDTPHIQHGRLDPDRYFGGLEKFLDKHV